MITTYLLKNCKHCKVLLEYLNENPNVNICLIMITDIELKKKVEILTNKLKAGLFLEVINETKLILNKRKHQVLFNLLSLSYQSLGEHDKSIEIMEIALKANSKNPHLLNNIGLSHFKLDNFKKAEEYFKRGLD